MADTTRTGWSFAAGVMVGGAVALWASIAWLLPAMGPALHEGRAAVEEPPAQSTAQVEPVKAEAANRTATGVEPSEAACGFEPLLTRAGRRDGRFSLEAAASQRAPQVRSYVAASRDAARQGRSRDSEVALLAACRLAAGKWPLVSVPVADVQSLLGRRYMEAAAVEPDEALRARLLERAEGLLEQSLLAYTVVLGSDASKSRMAAKRVALLTQAREQGLPLAGTPDAEFATASALATLGASAQPYWGGLLPAPGALDPGAPAATAAAVAPALIQSDPELTQMEADLERLRAQAANVTRDPEGLRQRSSQAVAQRDAQCHDKPCLLRWYSQRKRELFAEF